MPRSIGMYTVSDEQIRQAASIGVRYHNLCSRVAKKRWSVEKAISTPLSPSETRDEAFYDYVEVFATYGDGSRICFGSVELGREQIETASRNGIRYHTLYNRIARKGWDIQEALTKPPNTKGIKSDRYTSEQLKEAEKNGVLYDTLRKRLDRGWTMEEAITRPPRKVTKHEYQNFIN